MTPLDNTHNIFDTPSMRYTFGIRIFYFLLITFAGLMVALVAMSLALGGGVTAMSLRIGTVAQDLFLFILPAIVTAMMVSVLPARMLCADRLPSFMITVMALLAWTCSIPAMNALVAWNEGLSLPSALAPVEQWMRQAEEAARSQVEVLLGGTSVGALVVNILIVGVLAGVSEELYFRGALQRLISSGGRVNHHVAIWVTAVLFSAFHMQFFGFFPRLVLGAFFGYLMWWSGSVWLPALVHAVNNSLVVCATWRQNVALASGEGSDMADPSAWGADSILAVSLSVVLTVVALWLLKNTTHFRNGVTRG